jgi:hypothetical protein
MDNSKKKPVPTIFYQGHTSYYDRDTGRVFGESYYTPEGRIPPYHVDSYQAEFLESLWHFQNDSDVEVINLNECIVDLGEQINLKEIRKQNMEKEPER